MGILLLPSELLQLCLEHAVRILTRKDAVRLRLVCKHLRDEIIRVIAVVSWHQQRPVIALTDGNQWPRYPEPPGVVSLRTEYLYHWVLLDKRREYAFSACINECVDYLAHYLTVEDGSHRLKLLWKMCHGVSQCSFPGFILHHPTGYEIKEPNQICSMTNYILVAAAYFGEYEIIRRFREKEDYDLRKNYLIGCPLTFAAVQGHHDIVKEFLDETGAPLRARSSALQAAASAGHYDVALEIISQTQKTGLQLWSTCMDFAVSNAASHGHSETLLAMFQHYKLPRFREHGWGRVLDAAAANGHNEIVRLALKHGTTMPKLNRVTQRGSCRSNAFVIAAGRGHLEVMRTLLPLTQADSMEYAVASSEAARFGFQSSIQLLLDNGYEVNSFCDLVNPPHPLVSAAQNGQLEMVQFLFACGLKITGESDLVNRALEAASSQGYVSVTRILDALSKGEGKEIKEK